MPTILTARTPVTTTYNLTRLWWAYLLDWNWDYILDSEGERIIVIVTGGQLPFIDYTARTQPMIHYYFEVSDWIRLQIDDTNDLQIQDSEIGVLYTTRIIP